MNKFKPVLGGSSDVQAISKLLFETQYPRWLWNTMYVAVGSHDAVDHRQRARGLCHRAPEIQGR